MTKDRIALIAMTLAVAAFAIGRQVAAQESTPATYQLASAQTKDENGNYHVWVLTHMAYLRLCWSNSSAAGTAVHCSAAQHVSSKVP
ncbi:MAG: hypothetical protein JOZ72_01135 [Alphaproteobacteria bacterium]|nr:hypothetical protein [Alphaproteobacteria bacterium]